MDAERCHFLDVCWPFMKYEEDVSYDLGRIEEAINSLDANDMALWEVDGVRLMKELKI